MIFNFGGSLVPSGQVPVQIGTLTYNGKEQRPVWSSYDQDRMIIGGVYSATDAGTYTATFTPARGYQWEDGATDTRAVSWTIGRKEINVPSQSMGLTYNGSVQKPVWNDFDDSQVNIGGDVSAANAGDYTAMFTPNGNHMWSDGTIGTRNVTWTIGRKAIGNVPSQSGSLTYNGKEQSPAWNDFDPVQLAIGGDTSAINAGSYNASFTPTSNYKWPDDTTAAKSIAWTVKKAAGSLSINPISLSLTSAEKTKKIAVTRAGDGTITASSSDTNAATVSVSGTNVVVTAKANGSAIITVKVAEGTNHNAPGNKTCTVSVLLDLMLYDNGNTFNAVTGGFISRNGAGGKFTLDADKIAFTFSGDNENLAQIYTVNKVDITDFKTLYADVDVKTLTYKNEAQTCSLGLHSTNTSKDSNGSSYTGAINTGRQTLSLDISKISGSFYVYFRHIAAKGSIYKIWAE